MFPFAKKVGGLLPSGFDELVLAFSITTGATDLDAIDDLIEYVRAESLLNNFRLYPQKKSQNYGTGSTVEGIGELTANNMTLIGSPTWGADGITMNASTQYGSIADPLGSETLTVWCRSSGATTGNGRFLAHWDGASSQRSVIMSVNSANTSMVLFRSSNGTSATDSQDSFSGGGAESLTTSDTTRVAQWINGGNRNLWLNNTSQALTLASGTAQTTHHNSSVSVTQNAVHGGGNFLGGTYRATAFLAGVTPTTTQRETITDLINAL